MFAMLRDLRAGSVRAGAAGDVGAAARILNDWISRTDWMPRLYSHEDIAGFLGGLQNAGRMRVAVRGSRVTGFSVLGDVTLDCLYVAEPGRGTGRMLLDDAKARMPGGFTLWTFQENRAAIRFYTREGMHEIERSDGSHNEEGLPDVALVWPGRGVLT